MASEKNCTITFFASGYCTSHQRIATPGMGSGEGRFYAVWALLQHKTLGTILFDTGYSSHFFEATKKFPDRLYRMATPVFFHPEESAKEQLSRLGISSDAISYIIISHFHGDHIAGLLDFDKAQFICTRSAFEEAMKVSGISAVKKGILKKLIPANFSSRVLLVEDISESTTDSSELKVYHSVLYQEDFKLIELPGHARGMLGLWMEQDNLLFATDAAWDLKAFDQNLLPNKIVSLFFDSWKAYTNTWKKLKRFQELRPDTRLVFTHCPETRSLIHSNNSALC